MLKQMGGAGSSRGRHSTSWRLRPTESSDPRANMPRHPSSAPSANAVAGSVFSQLAHRIASYEGERYPLHVGDTWMAPPVDPTQLDLPDTVHRYALPKGTPELVDALARDIGGRHDLEVDPADLFVTAGATEGLAVVAGAMCSPGDEVLVLAPHWPLIHGILTWNRATPVRVDILNTEDAHIADALREAVTDRTVAIYVNTPSNPTGRVLPRSVLTAIAQLAREHDLYLLADEVYEHHQFVGEHVAMRTVAPERTVSVHSLSKALGLAGYRVGAVVVPPELRDAVAKVRTHASYNTATLSQEVALAALRGPGAEWVKTSRILYEEAGRKAAARLGVPRVDGGTFLFVDVADSLDDRGLMGFLSDCADRGVFISPGPSFGDYPTHVRVCFTCASPALTERGVSILAERMGR